MSEKKAERDFVGFAEDVRSLRFAIRASLGLSPQRPLERMRMNTRALSERLRPQEQPQQSPGCTGQRARIPGLFGFLDALLGQQQGHQPRQPEEPLTSEEEERLRQYEEELRRKREEETRKERATRVQGQTDFSPIL